MQQLWEGKTSYIDDSKCWPSVPGCVGWTDPILPYADTIVSFHRQNPSVWWLLKIPSQLTQSNGCLSKPWTRERGQLIYTMPPRSVLAIAELSISSTVGSGASGRESGHRNILCFPVGKTIRMPRGISLVQLMNQVNCGSILHLFCTGVTSNKRRKKWGRP